MTIPAVACALAGIRAVEPRQVMRAALDGLRDTIGDGAVTVVAMGKAAAAMAHGAAEALGDLVTEGIVVAPSLDETLPPDFAAYAGDHPVPGERSGRAGAAIESLVQRLGANDTLLCLISGGASSLTALPPQGIAIADAGALTTQLLRAGATIGELNTVRKHTDRLKGGRLAKLAAPARVVTLVLSDVVGDRLDVIASGPTVPDTTTSEDAIRVLRARGVYDAAPPGIRAHLERGADPSPVADDPCFARSTARVVASVADAAEAARAHAASLGYDAEIETITMTGEARTAGAEIAESALGLAKRTARDGVARCRVHGGETTVTVTGDGVGGRNQELALGAARALDGAVGITVASLGTDGVDGPTDAAGAVATGTTLAAARALGLDADAALANNDAYAFWRAVGGLVVTGPTGTNVMDLVVVTIDRPRLE